MFRKEKELSNKKRIFIVILMLLFTLVLFIINIFFGSSSLSFIDTINAIFLKGSDSAIRIVYNIRFPRIIAAFLVGGALALSGVIMQVNLNNDLASPSTLGVSKACVFGANLSILFISGYIESGNNINIYLSGINIYGASIFALIFGIINIFIILLLSNIKKFSPLTTCLIGIALGYIFNALTILLQYLSTDIGLSAALIWSFGDLSRATYKIDLIILVCLIISFIFFEMNSYKYNSLLNGEDSAISLGINTKYLRIISLFIVSILISLCVSNFGIIGFIGLIAPQISKRIVGRNYLYLIPISLLTGSIILLFSDLISRSLLNGSSLPVGAITSLIGAPLFLIMIFLRKKDYA